MWKVPWHGFWFFLHFFFVYGEWWVDGWIWDEVDSYFSRKVSRIHEMCKLSRQQLLRVGGLGHKFNFGSGDNAKSHVACVRGDFMSRFVTCNCNKTNNRRNFVTSTYPPIQPFTGNPLAHGAYGWLLIFFWPGGQVGGGQFLYLGRAVSQVVCRRLVCLGFRWK